MKLFTTILFLTIVASTWSTDITGRVELFEKKALNEEKAEKVTGVAVYLLPKNEETEEKIKNLPVKYQMLNQKGKQFVPTMLVVQKGAEVRFGNEDPWFHNIYGNDPKFNLGRFPRGFWKKQIYEKTGVFHVYCDIHPNMHAHVYVVDTPYYTKTEDDGSFVLKGVVPGEYQIVAWQLRSAAQNQDITVLEEHISDIIFELHETKAKADEKNKNQPYSRSLLRKLK